MKKLVTIGIILVIAVLTNPDRQKHIEAIKDIFSEKLSETMANEVASSSSNLEAAGTALGMTLGLAFIDKFLENVVQNQNYIFFSLTEVRFGGKSRIIGFGAFGNVWIVDDVKNLLNDISTEKTSLPR